jgi:hypothetical protein
VIACATLHPPLPFSGIGIRAIGFSRHSSETDVVSIYDEPKIDNTTTFDPAHFGYAPDAWYHPVANEQARRTS